MGASGYSDHIVVCGWNATARELVDELQRRRVQRRGSSCCTRASAARPAADVYFVRGDTTSTADLERAGIPDAAAAIVCPSDGVERGRHALDPHRPGDRDDGPAGAHRRRGQQPQARRARARGRTPTRSW